MIPIRASHPGGLTRVEMVIVAGIAAVTMGLLLPALQKLRAGGRHDLCRDNLRQIAIGTLNYHDYYGRFAPGMDDQYVGALVPLLPFVGRDDLYNNFSFDPRFEFYWQNPYNRPPATGTDDIPRPPDLYGCEGEVDLFLCPDGPQPDETVTALMLTHYGIAGEDYRDHDGFGQLHLFTSSPGRLIMARSHYLAMAGDWRDPALRGIFRYNSRTRLADLLRGPENTILYAEYWGGYVSWHGQNGIPSGWSNGSRCVGFNYSAFGTCPNRTNSNCDYDHSFGLSWGVFGALHPGPAVKHPYSFNIAMADGSVRSLPGDIDYTLWRTLCGIGESGSPIRGEPEEAWAGTD